MEKAQLVDRRLLSLHALRSHPAGGGAVQGDDRRGTEPHELERLARTQRQCTRPGWHFSHQSSLLKIPRPVTRCLAAFFSGREEAQELPGAGSLHALLHTLQEPRAQLSGKRV